MCLLKHMEKSNSKQKVNSGFCVHRVWGPRHCNPSPQSWEPLHCSPHLCATQMASLLLKVLVHGGPALFPTWRWQIVRGNFFSYSFHLLGASFQSGVQPYRGSPKVKGAAATATFRGYPHGQVALHEPPRLDPTRQYRNQILTLSLQYSRGSDAVSFSLTGLFSFKVKETI